MNKVRLIYYTTRSGRSVVEDALLSFSSAQQDKIQRAIRPIVEFGIGVHLRNTRKLSGTPLWEIRILGKDNIRIIYAVVIKDSVMLLHIFSKKSQKTPTKDLDLALQRYTDARQRLTS